ncbi:UPF0711 protein C18orf21 homolog isoform X2 [Xyrichtys novacula]|uniref:UPF0711 protein C18orf21 homolog isoform X2 n=1 Tax=Xyrichtys novacula TaxID=13765 RepID=A0AAV1HDA9_XYRNO|nr:UPF0711 protein C18orf21 homolog isoform X2 [Xyrichtys novacula]
MSPTPLHRWVGQLLGLYKAGLTGCCSKHSTRGSLRDKNFEPVVLRNPTLTNRQTDRHLSESEMATFVSMATCHTCNTTSRHRGIHREFIPNFSKTHSTPGSAGKYKTPQSTGRSNTNTPKTPGKDKTPVHTPRSSISSNTSGSSSSSSKPASKPKNWVVQRLSKILMREDNPGGKKGGLKDFLSSL